MKTLKIIAILVFPLLFLFACGSPRAVTDPKYNGAEISPEEADSTEYELVIFDSDFNTWMSMHSRPISFYSLEYLKSWNDRLVTEWNNFSPSRGRDDCRPNSYLDWDPDEDYGKELHYQLFHYFRYMHERCRIFMSTPTEWR
jgi:hypothetical protein